MDGQTNTFILWMKKNETHLDEKVKKW
jgi:hypothetical protein